MASIARAADGRLAIPTIALVRAAAWPLAMITLLAHVAWGDASYTPFVHLCGGILGAITLLVCAYSRPGILPVLPLVMLRFYLAMGFPIFKPSRMWGAYGMIRISSHSYEESAGAGLLFASVLLLVFLGAERVGKRFRPGLASLLDRKGEYTGRDTVAVRAVAGTSALIHYIIMVSETGQAVFGSLGYVATLVSASSLSLGLLFWDAEMTGSYSSKLVFWLAVTVLTLAGLSQGMLGSALEPIILTTLFLWLVRGRVPAGLIIAAMIALVGLNSAKHVYRRLTWHQTREIGLFERAENWLIALDETYSGQSSDAVEHSATTTVDRLSSLVLVAHMFEWVPARVPHAGPQAWLNLPLEFVPRFIWADKPMHHREFSDRYTTTFRIQTYRQTQGATFTLPSVGDGFWRLGWFGVVLEGALLGMLVGIYQGLSDARSRSLSILGVGFAIGAGPESHVLGFFSGLPQYWIAGVTMLLFVQALPSLFAGARKTELVRSVRAAPKVS